MRCARLTRLVILLPLISCGSCATVPTEAPASKQAVQLPPPPAFMGTCPASAAAAGMPPNQGFDAEHAALKRCSRNGGAARSWYLGVRKRYSGAKP